MPAPPSRRFGLGGEWGLLEERLLGEGRWEMVRTQSDESERILTQIAETTDEPQQIVVQRLLSCLQYRVPYTSRLQEI